MHWNKAFNNLDPLPYSISRPSGCCAMAEQQQQKLSFTQEDFEKVAQEVLNPDLTGYEFFVESHGTKIYRHYKEVASYLARHSGGGASLSVAKLFSY